MAEPATADELRAAREREYGQYVATENIYIDRVLAFRKGDAVPASHVDRGVVSADVVAKSTTKAAKAATGQEG